MVKKDLNETRIILIVGPSGAGKDTLINAVRGKVDANIVTRYITRPPDEFEQNYYVDKDAFLILKQNDFFFITWEAHSNFYGIPLNQIERGINIISVSRTVISKFEEKFEDTITVEITAPKELIVKRLIKRHRESKKEIEKRLERYFIEIKAKKLITFENKEKLSESIKKFKDLIDALIKEKKFNK